MREFETALPPGVKWRIDRNNAEEFRRRLSLVLENAVMAVGIVLIETGVRMPVGTTPAQAAEIADAVTQASLRMFDEHNLHEVAEGIKTNVRGESFIDVEIVMKPPDQRDMTAKEVIDRRDGRRIVSVSMDVEPQRAVNQVIHALRTEELPQLREDFPGITWSFEGSDAEMRRATASLWGSFCLALVVIYSLLAIAIRGYIQPLIVLVAIPFGIVGAVLGHILLGYDLSLIFEDIRSVFSADPK